MKWIRASQYAQEAIHPRKANTDLRTSRFRLKFHRKSIHASENPLLPSLQLIEKRENWYVNRNPKDIQVSVTMRKKCWQVVGNLIHHAMRWHGCILGLICAFPPLMSRFYLDKIDVGFSCAGLKDLGEGKRLNHVHLEGWFWVPPCHI